LFKLRKGPVQTRLSVAVILAVTQVASAQAAGDPERGRALATRWCSSCHVATAEQISATTEAPTFESIAERSAEEIERLSIFLTSPHGPMPPLDLSRTEIDDLIAFIQSLKSVD
jgi:mono/diheme cytochrome c family protein